MTQPVALKERKVQQHPHYRKKLIHFEYAPRYFLISRCSEIPKVQKSHEMLVEWRINEVRMEIEMSRYTAWEILSAVERKYNKITGLTVDDFSLIYIFSWKLRWAINDDVAFNGRDKYNRHLWNRLVSRTCFFVLLTKGARSLILRHAFNVACLVAM